MTTTYKHLAAGTALALVLSGFAGGAATAASASGSSGDAGQSKMVEHRHMSHDLHFATMMIPHHEDAIAMAELALERSGRAEVRELAQRIIDAQSPEIEELQAAVDRLSAAQGGHGHHHGRHGHGHHHGQGMHGGMSKDMMDQMDLAELAKLSGDELDRAFLEQMIAHHQMAVEMAQMELARDTDPEVREMAQQTIEDQDAEIELMQGWLTDWFGA